MLKTSGLLSNYYIVSRRERGLVGRGEVGQWVAGSEEVIIHVAQMGTLPLEGPEEQRAGGGERRYPSMLHRRAPFSHQESRERRLSSRKRLRNTGFCSSINSQKEPILTQSPPSAARKILRGRAPVCRRVALRQKRLAKRICESCGRRAARACALAAPSSGT
jgi:hypothetical protein